jgi:hypothetical protein
MLPVSVEAAIVSVHPSVRSTRGSGDCTEARAPFRERQAMCRLAFLILLLVTACVLVSFICENASKAQTGSPISSRKVVALRMDNSSGHPKVYVSRSDLETALGKKFSTDKYLLPAVVYTQGSSRNPSAGKPDGPLFAGSPPLNDKLGSGYMLVFDSAQVNVQLKQYAFIAVLLAVPRDSGGEIHSNWIVVKMK